VDRDAGDQDGRIVTLIDWGLLTANGPDGARALLSTVAGSIITVAGVVFSLTMLVLIQASSQFGPRLLVNFMHDRTNQVVLGAFVATFVYSILVLRVVRIDNAELGVAEFVPHLSTGVALLLTFVSVALLVYFFHHTAEGVPVSHVLAGISRVMERRIEQTTVPAAEATPPPRCRASSATTSRCWTRPWGASSNRSTSTGSSRLRATTTR